MSYERAHVVREVTVETDRNFSEVADSLNLSRRQLAKLINGKKVMDMGSGIGRFAVEVEVLKRRWLLSGKTEVFSLNERYAHNDYPTEWLNAGGREMIKQYGGNPRMLKDALATLKENALPYNWHDLSALIKSGRRFDVVLSSYAFPYYSDFYFKKPDSGSDMRAVWDGTFEAIMFGPESKEVFRQLSQLMADGGVCVLTTKVPASAFYKVNQKFRDDFRDFFESIGFEISLSKESATGPAILTLRKALKKESGK